MLSLTPDMEYEERTSPEIEKQKGFIILKSLILNSQFFFDQIPT